MIQPNHDFFGPCSASSTDLSHGTVAENSTAAESASNLAEKAKLIALVRRAAAEEPAAQTELVHLYSRRVAGFVRAIIRQPDAVDDVSQTVFIKMFRRLSRLRDPAVFESWLFTLARNSCLDFIRRRNCRPSTVAIDDQVNEIPDPSTSSGTAEILAALDRALARLSPTDRVLVSQFVAGDSYSEIASRAGLSLATVKVRLHRVRPFLRTCVGEMTDTRQPNGKGWRCLAGSRPTTGWPVSSENFSARAAA